MGRLRNVGKQAASDDDVVTLAVVRAYIQALPGQYLELSRLNQPNGVAQLDTNARMQNLYLPTDISQTTLTASGEVKGATVRSTGPVIAAGQLTADSAAIAKGITAGTTIAATGAITGASATVTGQVKAATEDVPENVAATHRVKALTVDTIQQPAGGLSVVGNLASSTGSVTAATDVVATRDVTGGRNVRANGGSVSASVDVTATETLRGKNAVVTANVAAASANVSGKTTTNELDVAAGAVVYGDLGVQGNLVSQGQQDVIGWLSGRIAALEGGDALVPWIVPTLNSGVTSSSFDPFMYRIVNDYGRRKVQMRGRLNLTSAIVSLFTMPAGSRPALDLAPIIIGRDFAGGSTTIVLDIKSSGLINLAAHTVGIKGTSGQTAIGGGSASVTTSSAQHGDLEGTRVSLNHAHAYLEGQGPAGWINPAGGDPHFHRTYSASHAHTVTGLSHQHVLDPVTYPAFVGFTGVEYFL